MSLIGPGVGGRYDTRPLHMAKTKNVALPEGYIRKILTNTVIVMTVENFRCHVNVRYVCPLDHQAEVFLVDRYP